MIRLAEVKDIGSIYRLLRQIADLHHNGRPDIFKKDAAKYDEEDIKDIIKNKNRPILVAVDEDGYVIGYCFFILKKESGTAVIKEKVTLYIDDLCVDENHRNRGIGKKLFETVLDYAKKEGVTGIELNVWEFNESALRFYEDLGFKSKSRSLEMLF